MVRVAVNRSNFSGRKYWGRTFWSNYRDRMECGRILSNLLYGTVASLPSPSSNIEAWPYGTSLRFASAFRALGVCEHIWLRYKNFDPSCFDPVQKFGIVDLRTNSNFRSRSFDLFPPTLMVTPSGRLASVRYSQRGSSIGPNVCFKRELRLRAISSIY